jgi:hypothetical protein
MGGVSLADVIPLVERLSPEEQLSLIEHVVHELREGKRDQIRHWREFRGLGKEIWQGIDAQEYVNKLRDEWER